jgi:hypothetical protein
MAEAFVMHGASGSAYVSLIQVLTELLNLGDLEVDRKILLNGPLRARTYC